MTQFSLSLTLHVCSHSLPAWLTLYISQLQSSKESLIGGLFILVSDWLVPAAPAIIGRPGRTPEVQSYASHWRIWWFSGNLIILMIIMWYYDVSIIYFQNLPLSSTRQKYFITSKEKIVQWKLMHTRSELLTDLCIVVKRFIRRRSCSLAWTWGRWWVICVSMLGNIYHVSLSSPPVTGVLNTSSQLHSLKFLSWYLAVCIIL